MKPGSAVLWVECCDCQAPMLARIPDGADPSKVRCRACSQKVES
jgi:hypothetical protein